MTPTINLNGTNPRQLYDDMERFCSHVAGAIKVASMIWPNGRDYVGDPEGMRRDTDEVILWTRKLDEVYKEALKTLGYLADYI